MAMQKKKRPERLNSIQPTKTFSYMEVEKKESSNPSQSDEITLPSTDYRRVNGTKSSSARVWVDTLNRLNSLVTMQYADSINELIMIMLDDFEDRLDDNDLKYQELLLKMYNNKK